VIHVGDWRSLLDVVSECDALIVDAPYSERTHAGHDDGTAMENRQRRAHKCADATRQISDRRKINYGAWSPDDVRDFVDAWSPRTRGWLVSITDHVLIPAWSSALEAAGRYVFSPIAYVAPGSRVRLTGDGPAQWSCWIVVARPRLREFLSWGALPGAYVLPEGHGGKLPVVGGKPLWLLSRLVEDYSRPGDLVVDPCCGAGTTLVAALRSGRRAIGGDINPEHAELARLWTANPHLSAPRGERRDDEKQAVLF
jgi:site-specific DNA-methyltransferase (adenine-specific)